MSAILLSAEDFNDLYIVSIAQWHEIQIPFHVSDEIVNALSILWYINMNKYKSGLLILLKIIFRTNPCVKLIMLYINAWITVYTNVTSTGIEKREFHNVNIAVTGGTDGCCFSGTRFISDDKRGIITTPEF